MSSHRIEQQLSAYLDGELTADEMAEVRRHLSASETLRGEFEELQQTKRLLGRLQTPDLPPSFTPELWARVDRARGRRWFEWPQRFWWPRPAVAFAAVALAVVLVAVPLVRGHRDGLRAAEMSPDLFIRAATQAASQDPFMDRAYLGLVTTDANLRLVGEEPRGSRR